MRILVTGGAGFIGTNVVRRLLIDGHEPVVFDDFSTGLMSNIADLDIQILPGCLTNEFAVRSAVEGADVIVHLGARGSVPRSVADPVGAHRVNATGTFNVLEAARVTGAHVIFSSSSSVYGANPLLPKTERTWTQPMSPYASSKLAAEGYVMGYKESYGLRALVLRLFNVFGPWQRPDHDYAAVIPKWLWKAINGDQVEIHGDGTQTRDFTYVDSVVDVIMEAINTGISPESPVNLAFGRSLSLIQVLDEMQRVLGVSIKTNFAPARIGDVRNSENDPNLLSRLFPGVIPTALADGLGITVEWLISTTRERKEESTGLVSAATKVSNG